MRNNYPLIIIIAIMSFLFPETSPAQTDSLDARVMRFLEANKYNWREMNVPEEDGRVLYDIILKNGYRNALEIGTSTGRSGIWIAWALSKTGGKLITLEIDEVRFEIAKRNFRMAGLQKYIEQHLGDAHEIVSELDGPFDFIFVDADKSGYTHYVKTLLPKLEKDGCFTAHNVSNSYMSGIAEFLEYLRSVEFLETKIDNSSNSGISISYKKK